MDKTFDFDYNFQLLIAMNDIDQFHLYNYHF